MVFSIATATPVAGNFLQAAPLSQTPQTGDSLSLLGWMAGFVLAAGVLAVVARPLLVTEGGLRRTATRSRLDAVRSKLESLYERAAAERQSLDELEFDRELGNLDEQDYLSLKQQTEEKLAGLEEKIKMQVLLVEQTAPTLAEKRSLRQTPVKAPSLSTAAIKEQVRPRYQESARDFSQKVTESRLKTKPAPNIKEKLKCSECANPFKPGDRFCSKCGAPLPHLCLSCGAELIHDERFCKKCGAAVNN